MTHMRHRHFGSSMDKNGRLKFISPAKKIYTGSPYFFPTSSPGYFFFIRLETEAINLLTSLDNGRSFWLTLVSGNASDTRILLNKKMEEKYFYHSIHSNFAMKRSLRFNEHKKINWFLRNFKCSFIEFLTRW